MTAMILVSPILGRRVPVCCHHRPPQWPAGVQDEDAHALDAVGPVIHVSVQEDDVCNKFRGTI